MKIINRPFPGAALIALEPIGDDRGTFTRIFDKTILAQEAPDLSVDHTAESFNPNAFTLRGLHFQKPPYEERKLIRCIKGRIFDVAVDLREDSPTEGEIFHIILTEDDDYALFLPKGVAHGFLTLTNNSCVSYHLFDPYHSPAATGIRYDDIELAIPWPKQPQIMNDRDRHWPLLKDLPRHERSKLT